MSDEREIGIPDVAAMMRIGADDPTERRMHLLERDLAATAEAYRTACAERDAALSELARRQEQAKLTEGDEVAIGALRVWAGRLGGCGNLRFDQTGSCAEANPLDPQKWCPSCIVNGGVAIIDRLTSEPEP